MMKSKNLLMIFTRNPELGKVKTRLAAGVGEQTALDIYKFLLEHTATITKDLDLDKQVHYSVKVRSNDVWDSNYFHKKQQHGDDLGVRMMHAFQEGFEAGYEQIIIIGSDMYDISQTDLENAFLTFQKSDFVIGPAQDGGYYLLGMKKMVPEVFQNKKWGTSTVLENTKRDLIDRNVKFLEEKNDIDIFDDIKDIPFFMNNYLKNLKL